MKDFMKNFKIKIIQTLIIIFLFQQISSQTTILNSQEHSDNFENSEYFNNVISLVG
jgi:hypothetical protein